MTGVTLDGVLKRYGDVEVIHGIDLAVEDGEFCVFVGPSGCGKSTLLTIVGALGNPTSGSVAVGGEDVRAMSAAARARFRPTSP